MFTPLGTNHPHNICAVKNNLLDTPQKETLHYGTYSIIFTASVTWNDLLRNTNQTFLDCKIDEFKRKMSQTHLVKYSNSN